jgi:phosphoribosylformylglycinamidine (FGAM) synthase-like amidotransferase family enzyme
MRIAVIQASHNPDVVSALERAGMMAVEGEADGYIITAAPTDQQFIIEAAAQGKPILGMGEGVSFLLETGLIPGLENNKPAITLTEPAPAQETWVHLRLPHLYQRNAFTRHLSPDTVLHLPVANSKTRFVMSAVLLQEIEEQGLNIFHYCDEAGVSTNDIAALANKAGNVMAVLPQLASSEMSDPIFKSMHDYIKKGVFNPVNPLHYYPRKK